MRREFSHVTSGWCLVTPNVDDECPQRRDESDKCRQPPLQARGVPTPMSARIFRRGTLARVSMIHLEKVRLIAELAS